MYFLAFMVTALSFFPFCIIGQRPSGGYQVCNVNAHNSSLVQEPKVTLLSCCHYNVTDCHPDEVLCVINSFPTASRVYCKIRGKHT